MKNLTVNELALYLGCEVEVDISQFGDHTKGLLVYVDLRENIVSVQFKVGQQIYRPDFVKPILRPLPDITEEEMKDIWKVVFNKAFHSSGQILFFDKETTSNAKRWVLMSGVERLGICLNGAVWADSDLHNYKFNPNLVTKHLLSKHFDIFNWIEQGLALDATKQPQS